MVKIIEGFTPNSGALQQSTNNTTILFYQRSCGMCMYLSRLLDRIAEEVTDENVHIFRFLGKDHPNLVKQYGIKHYPTLMHYNNGKIYHYRGNKTKDDIKKWIIDRSKDSPII